MPRKISKLNRSQSPSSRQWLLRQMNDPFVIKAKREGYRSRAAFKLMEIHEKYKIFQKNQTVVDLGCAPGSWLHVVQQKVKTGLFVGLDLQDMEPLKGTLFHKKDFIQEETTLFLLNCLKSSPVHVVLSDMAPSACGIPKVDALRIFDLFVHVLDFSEKILVPEGTLVAKILRGGTETKAISLAKPLFNKVCLFKPRASRLDSAEIYMVALGFKGR